MPFDLQTAGDPVVSLEAAGTDDDLVTHLHRLTGLAPEQVRRIIGEVVAYFDEGVEDYVRRRHAELKLVGVRNEEIFRRVQGELVGRVVRAPDLSTRQLRRIVYG